MKISLLDSDLHFPDPNQANSDGLVAVGGDLSPERILLAYEHGIFPWFSPGDPILWWSPNPRCVLFVDDLKISKSMRNILNRGEFKCTFDQAFEQVISSCANIDRDEEGTWITEEMKLAYLAIHQLGIGHSIEVWKGDDLVGGLYGLSIGNMFFGESMFSRESNASKVAFIHLVNHVKSLGMEMIDCQVYNDHLSSLGACEISRQEFLEKLSEAMNFKTRRGNWGEVS